MGNDISRPSGRAGGGMVLGDDHAYASSQGAGSSGSRPGPRPPNESAGILDIPRRKAHESLPSSHFGLPAYQGRTVDVNSNTMANLAASLETSHLVKTALPYGSGNQLLDHMATGGESHVRNTLARLSVEPDRQKMRQAGFTDAQMTQSGLLAGAALKYQAGNCAETAGLAFFDLSRKTMPDPVRVVEDENASHVYTLIGDHREKPANEVVVVDPWPGVAAAYTLAEAKDLHPAPHALAERGPNEPPSIQALRMFDNAAPIKSSSVVKEWDELGQRSIGPFLPLINSQTLDGVRDVRTGAKDPSTAYTDGSSTRTFDDNPVPVLGQQEQGVKALEDARRKWGGEFKW